MSIATANTVLNSFNPITLSEMDSVKLMDRTDTKFVFHVSKLPLLLEKLKPHYRALEVSAARMSKYETLYYDTANYDLYMRHQCGKMNRFKIRSRKYVESDLCFFEIKFKNNKKRTIKNRIKTKGIEQELGDKSKKLLAESTSIVPDTLNAALWVNYSRITLVNNLSPERLTIDVGLHFIKNNNRVDYGNLVIAEVKQDKANSISPVLSTMKEMRIQIGSISKYCLGVMSCVPDIKMNNFKENVRYIHKIINHHAA
jgi:hypothetical protein